MTPEQALAYLDEIVAQVSMNRAQHVRAQQAIETLRAALDPPREARARVLPEAGARGD